MVEGNSLLSIAKSLEFYSDKGFSYIETPWVVDEGVSEETMPENATPFSLKDNRTLVGSAEQGFLQLMLQGKLKEGKFCSFSPCFRDDEEDIWHTKTFYKLELLQNIDVNMDSLINMLYLAKTYFSRRNLNTEIVKTEIGLDLISKKSRIELGSYGIREVGDLKWVYGTGCAEPRLSQVKYYETRH